LVDFVCRQFADVEIAVKHRVRTAGWTYWTKVPSSVYCIGLDLFMGMLCGA